MATIIKQSTQITVLLGPVVDATDGVTLESGLSAAGTEIDKNGGGFNAGPTTGTYDEGYYPVTLSDTHTNTVGRLLIKLEDSTTHLPVWREFQVVEEAIYDALFADSATGFDSNGRVDVGEWLGTAVTSGTGGPDVNINAISDDTGAAVNLEAMYDGTGYTDDTAPSSRSQVDRIGAASVGALNFEAGEDNTGGAIIGGITFVGSQTGTYANTDTEDASYHQIDHTGNDIDIVYGFAIGGARTAVEMTFKGYLDGANDSVLIQAYDHVGAGWDTIATLSGQNNTDNVTITASLLSKHTGTGSELGNVYIRIDGGGDDTAPVLWVDLLNVAAVNVGQTVGYANGAIWVDTNASNTNTESFVDGVADNPVSTIAAAKTIADAVGLNRFQIASGSSITLATNYDAYEFHGVGWTCALGGQSVSGTIFEGATITGNDDGSNANATIYRDCLMGNNTLGLHRLEYCGLSDEIELQDAGTYDYIGCHSRVAGTSTPSVDFQSAAEVKNLNMRSYSGGIEMKNIGAGGGTHTMSLEGNGQYVLNANCAGGTLAVRGNFKGTDNAGGVVTVTQTMGLENLSTQPSGVPVWGTATVREIIEWVAAFAINPQDVTSALHTLRNQVDSGNLATQSITESPAGTASFGAWT